MEKIVTMDGIKYKITGYTKASKMAIGEWYSKKLGKWIPLKNTNSMAELYRKYH